MARKPTGVRQERNGNWTAHWTVNGHRHWRTFPTQRQAAEHRAMMLADAARGTYINPADSRITLAEWLPEYRASKQLAASSAEAWQSRADRHVLPYWGSVPLNRITFTGVGEWVTVLSKTPVLGAKEPRTLAPETVRSCFDILSGALDAAVRNRRIPSNPCTGVALPGRRDHPAIFLTAEQVEALTEQMRDRYRALVFLTAWTGMRWGEAAGLTRKRIDLTRSTLTVRDTLTEVGGRHGRGIGKTRRAQRTIHLPQAATDMLRWHLETHAGPELVFTGPRGGPLYRKFLNRQLRPAAERAGLDPALRFHDLRHTFAALAIAAGVSDLWVLKDLMGHGSITTTERYAHLLPDVHERTRRSLDAAARRVWPVCEPPENGTGEASE